MPRYQNYRVRKVTIFLQNSIPVPFEGGEVKFLTEVGLEKKYSMYIRNLDAIKETVKNEEKKDEKSLISEVKQPQDNVELIKEPVSEEIKKAYRGGKPKKTQVSEGYSPLAGEYTVGTVEPQK